MAKIDVEPSSPQPQPEPKDKEQKGTSCFGSSSDEDVDPTPLASFGELWRYASCTDWLCIFVGALGSSVVGAAQPGMMILFGELMDAAGASTPTEDEFNKIVINMIGIGVVCFVAAWIGEAGFKTSGMRQAAEWRKLYLRAILGQDVAWYDCEDSGQFSSNIVSTTSTLEEGISSKLSLGFRFGAQGIFGMFLSFWYAWDMALVLVCLSPIPMFGTWFMTKATTEAASDMSTAYALASGVAGETLGSLRTVSSLGIEKKQEQRYAENLGLAQVAGVRKSSRIGFANGILFASGNLLAAVGFLYAGFKMANQLEDSKVTINQGTVNETTVNCLYNGMPGITVDKCEYSGGDLMIALFCLQMGAQGLGLIEPTVTAIAKARQSAYKILEIVDRKVPIDSRATTGQKPSTPVQGKIVLEDVHFAYPNRAEQEIFRGFNLTVEAGTTVALVGQSGSGKSTTIQLVERFYDPAKGRVTLDGVDLKDLNVSWLRQQIGLVGQEPVLFSGTIAENIRNGKLDATQEDIEQAAKSANAYAFITDNFPDGFSTDVGEKGGQLSGGQKQRIAIARAILRDPAVLLLDEATSALDTESERIVQKALDDLLKKHKRTTIVIAHRLSTIRDADKIVVVDQGTVVEQGTHTELMDSQGLYYALNFNSHDDPGAAAAVREHNSGVAAATMRACGAGEDVPKLYPGVANLQSEPADAKNSNAEVQVTMDEEEPKTDCFGQKVLSEEEKAEAEKLAAMEKQDTTRVWGMHEGDNMHFFLGVIGALVVGGANPGVGIVFVKCMSFLYNADPDEVRNDSYYWASIMVGISLAQIVGDTARGWGFGVPGEKLTVKLRTMLYNAFVRQELGWHDMPGNGSGALCANLATDITMVQALSGETMGRNVLSLCTVICGITFAFVFGNPLIALVAFACIPIMISGMAVEIALLSGGTEGQAVGGLGKEATSIVGEAVSSIRTVSSFTLEKKFTDGFEAAIDNFLATEVCCAAAKGVFIGYAQLSLFLAFGLLYWYGGQQVSKEGESFERMFTPIFCMFMLGAGLGQAANGATDAAKAVAAARRVFSVVDRESAIDSLAETGTKDVTVTGAIALEGVHFAYPSRPEHAIFTDFNLTVEAGTTVALVGQSGSGKSTTIQLVERFYDPAKGRVTLDGVDLKDLNVSWLRQQIGLVGQEPVLFSGTIAENIRNGKLDATDDEVEQAAKSANAYDFITDQFPDGFKCDVGEKGGQLSGGQKQRIAIARAILRDPAVLLLDEATSALDNESERIVQEALDNLLSKHQRTTIVIAHRLSTIEKANKIVVVEAGTVVEQGTHAELIALGEEGKYYNLARAQGSH